MFQISVRRLNARGVLPSPPLFVELWYALATSLLFHMAVVDPGSLKPSYWTFMNTVTGGRLVNIVLFRQYYLADSFWPMNLMMMASLIIPNVKLLRRRVSEVNRPLLDLEYGCDSGAKYHFYPDFDPKHLSQDFKRVRHLLGGRAR